MFNLILFIFKFFSVICIALSFPASFTVAAYHYSKVQDFEQSTQLLYTLFPAFILVSFLIFLISSLAIKIRE